MTFYKKIPLDQNQREEIYYQKELLHYSIYMPKGDGFYWDIPWHWHEEFEFGYVVSGNLLYKTSRGEFELHAGDGIFINSGVLHALYSLEPQSEIQFYTQFVDRLFLAGAYGNLLDLKYVQPVMEQKKLEAICFSRERKEDVAVLELLRRAISIGKETEPFYELRLRTAFSTIWERIVACVEMDGQQADTDRWMENERLKCMMRFLQEHSGERVSVLDVAACVPISERECYRMFQSGLGMTPVEYLLTIRLQKASQLLRETKKSILEIAMETGFGTSSYLGMKFKQYYHMTPKEYRKFYAE